MSTALTCDDIFSCVAGHAYGLHAAGAFSTIRFCERDAWRRKVISHHFPGVPVHDDVRSLHGTRANLLVGGPPCQRTTALSAIHGYRTGESLWPEMRRVGQEGDYDWIVVEQPASAPAEWFAQVMGDMEADGYAVRRLDLSAWDVGALHIRPRVFTLAHRDVSRLEIAWQSASREAERIAGSADHGNPWLPGPPGGLRVADGAAGGLDGYSVGRKRRIEAIGDSNPPQMMTAIGRGILAGAGCLTGISAVAG